MVSNGDLKKYLENPMDENGILIVCNSMNWGSGKVGDRRALYNETTEYGKILNASW